MAGKKGRSGRPRKKPIVFDPAPPGASVARPNIQALAAEEELANINKDTTPDVPDPGEKQNARPKCVHGRLHKCGVCDGAALEKKQLEERDGRKDRLKGPVGDMHDFLFNTLALATSDDDLRLTPTQKQALAESGSSFVADAAPDITGPVISGLGYASTLGAVVTGKALSGGKDNEPSKTDRGKQEGGKDDAGKGDTPLRLAT